MTYNIPHGYHWLIQTAVNNLLLGHSDLFQTLQVDPLWWFIWVYVAALFILACLNKVYWLPIVLVLFTLSLTPSPRRTNRLTQQINPEPLTITHLIIFFKCLRRRIEAFVIQVNYPVSLNGSQVQAAVPSSLFKSVFLQGDKWIVCATGVWNCWHGHQHC